MVLYVLTYHSVVQNRSTRLSKLAELGAGETRAVLEVRSHDVPFLIEEGQTVCRLVYEPLSLVPEALYGAKGSGSHYQAQGLQLAKHFMPLGRESSS